MAEPVPARRLTDQEGRRLLQIVRRGKHGSVRVRRAMIIMGSASGTLVPAIARLVAAGEDTVRDVIHAFNAKGLAALGPRWAGGRPRLTRTTGITPRWPASCRPACAGVMPTPATPACWPPSAANAPASAANASNAGAARNLKLHNRAGESRPLCVTTSRAGPEPAQGII